MPTLSVIHSRVSILRKALGIFSRAHLETEKLFEELQAQSMLYIKEQFSMEDDKFKLEGSTWEEFFKAREAAEKEGTLSEFDQLILEQITPMFERLTSGGA